MFGNIGSYHAARLRAVQHACEERGWRMTAVQVTDSTLQHPWGDLGKEITFPIVTLLPLADTPPGVAEQLVANIRPATVLSAFDALQPDAVAVPGWGFAASRAVLRWCLRHRAVRVLMSETQQQDEPRSWWKELLKARLYVRRYQAALVGGESHRAYLAGLGFPGDRVFLGYDAVDNCHFAAGARNARSDPAAVRQQQPRLPRRPYVLSITRFLPRKAVPQLVESYATYRSRVGDEAAWDLVICGTGPEAETIERAVQRLGLESSVHLPGFVTYDALGAWYGLAQAFVHVPLSEPWGLVVNEACAAGLPIVCGSTVGARYELVQDGVSGFVVEPGNNDAIANALIKLHQMPEPERRAFGEAGAQLVAQFGPQRFASGLMAALNVSMSRHRAAR